MKRREFLAGSAAAAAGASALAKSAAAQQTVPKEGKLLKALIYGMLPNTLSMEDRFKLARDCGFEGIESEPVADAREAEARGEAARKAGTPIHSVIYGGWHAPLSSADPKVIEQGLQGVRDGLVSAKRMGATALLLVPGIVNESTRYIDCYTRSQKNVRLLIPDAEKQGVQILIEQVWNNFLMSPLEYARYIDDFKSPWVQSYLDVGNMVAFGWPEDWIRTVGKRIKRVHLKDFRRGPRQFVNLREGDINWPEVRKALGEVGYSGYLTAELNGGDEAYLRDLSQRIDKIIAGE